MAALTLITTVGSTTATTYADATYASEYFQTRLGGEQWPGDNETMVTAALLTAMRILEGLRFIGVRALADQRLEWPRVAITPRERANRRQRVTGYESLDISSGGLYDQRDRFWAATAIPYPIKDAQCEIAYAMLLDPSLNDPALIQATLKTGNLSIDHSKAAASRLRMAFESLQGLIEHGTRLNMSL